MELKTKFVLRVSDHLAKDRPSRQLTQGSGWKPSLKSAQTLFRHSAASLRRFSKLANFLQKSIYPSRFYVAFHSFTFRWLSGKNKISFSPLLVSDLTSVNFVPEGFSSTRSNYSFNLSRIDRYTSTGRDRITL